MRLHLQVIAITLALVAASSAQADAELDPITGLRMSDDWQLIRNNCVACHSARLITQQRGSAAQWLSTIRWMQEKQNLWQFDPGTEARIVAYLAQNYPPRDDRRRAAIAPELMPPNPLAPGTY